MAWQAALTAEADGRYSAAAKALLRLSAERPDELVPAGPGRYRPLAEWVLHRVAGWPEPHRRQYAEMSAGAGGFVLAEVLASGDADAMVRAAGRFPFAPGAERAFLIAGDRAYEDGRLETALDCWTRLLAAHPAPPIGQAAVLERLRLVRLRLGRSAPAGADDDPARPAAGPPPPPDEAPAALRPRPADGWPEPAAHDPARGHPGLPGTVLWRHALGTSEARPSHLSDEEPASVLPAAGEDCVYFHTTRFAWAVHRYTGKPVWKVRLNPDNGDDVCDPAPCAPTLDERRVYLRVGTEPGEADAFRRWDGPFGRLVALDRRDGRQVWTHGSYLTTAAGERLDALTFDSAPLPFAGRLYVVIRRRPPRLRETVYAMCLSPDDGRVLWAVPLADEGSESTARSTCLPTAAAGTVYFPTGIGAVAALSAHDGRIKWLATYDRPSPEPDDPVVGIRGGCRVLERPVLLGGRLVLLPAHGAELLVLSAEDGRRIGAIAKTSLDNPRQLLGVYAGAAVLRGDAVTAVSLADGAVRWRRDPGVPTTGGAVLTGGRVVLSGRRGTVTLSAADGSVIDSPDTPGRRPEDWRPTDFAGHGETLAATDGRTVVCLADPDAVQRLLRRRADADPAGGRRARLLAAELSLAAGRTAPAAEGLLRLLDDRPPAPAAGDADRARTFELILQVACRLDADGDRAGADRFFRLAESEQTGPADAVRRLTARADCLERRGAVADAVGALQEVLASADRRAVTLPDAPEEPAGRRAAVRISALIARHGGDCYRAVADRAAEALAGAEAGDDPDAALADVAARFPNSASAPAALERLADRALAAGRPAEAAALRRRVLGDPVMTPDRPAVLRRLAGDHAAAGAGLRAAVCRRAAELALARRPADRPTRLSWPLEEAFAADLPADAVAAAPTPPCPEVGWLGSDRMGVHDGRDGRALAGWPTPPGLNAAAAVGRCWAVRTADRVTIYEPGRPEPVWSRERFAPAGDGAAVPEPPVRRSLYICDWLSADGLLVIRWTDGLLEAVDPGDGPRSPPAMPWTLKLDGEPTGQMIGSDGLMAVLATKRDGLATFLVDVIAGRTVCELHRPGPAWPTALRWAGGELVLVYPDAVEAYDRADGRLLWRHATEAGETAPAGVAMDPGRVFLTDRSRRVTAFEARTGRTLWSVVPDAPDDPARGAVARTALLARRGGDVLVCDGRAIVALSAADGSLRWRAEVGGESSVRELIPGESAVLTVAGGQFGLPEPVEIAAFDPATGALLGRRRVADDGHATLVAAGDGTVVLLHRTAERCRLLGLAPEPPAP